jgi:hypothetical protein
MQQQGGGKFRNEKNYAEKEEQENLRAERIVVCQN